MPEMDGFTLARRDPQAIRLSATDDRDVDLARTDPECKSGTSGYYRRLSGQACATVATVQYGRQRLGKAPWRESFQPRSQSATAQDGCSQLDAFRRPLPCVVAEDNIVNQKVAARMVESLGLRADVAANGREAVEMFELLPYDLILMDCQMPEMDGYEATGQIRQREGSPRRVVIIAMTAEAMAGDPRAVR